MLNVMPRITRTSLLGLAVAALLVTAAPGRSADEAAKSDQPAQADKGGKPIRALLVIGGCCHDYEHQKDILTKGISARANVEWTVAYDPDKGTKHKNPVYDNPDWSKNFDVVVHDECSADVT